MQDNVTIIPIDTLQRAHPYAKEFFLAMGLKEVIGHLTAQQIISGLNDDFIEGCGLGRTQMLQHFIEFIHKMNDLRTAPGPEAQSLTIIGGSDKSGRRENVNMTIESGEIVCVVGLTGSGKSRLLADIECLAQGDTPTGRRILINGVVPDHEKRFAIEHKLVAQLSQNMNFVVDVSVSEFIAMHAESRLNDDVEKTTERIITCANELAGEPFDLNTPVTQLSGGQSRALMIADTALLSPLPIVVIDEIENAGVDRRKALNLLVKEEKIVLMSTHDPLLALMGGRRIVIRNGGISAVIKTSDREQNTLEELYRIDRCLMGLRDRIRTGGVIDFDMKEYFGFNGYIIGENACC